MNIPKKQPQTKAEKIAAYRENIPDLFNGSYRKQYDKAMSGRSLRAAANCKCMDCMCWQQAEVKRCENVVCPLHPYHPYQSSPDADSARQHSHEGAGKKSKGIRQG